MQWSIHLRLIVFFFVRESIGIFLKGPHQNQYFCQRRDFKICISKFKTWMASYQLSGDVWLQNTLQIQKQTEIQTQTHMNLQIQIQIQNEAGA